MNVKLSPELQRLIAEKVSSGEFHSPDEVISKGLELLQQQEKQHNGSSARSVDLVELFQTIAAEVPESEWAKIPSDLSRNLDHYLYGARKTS